MTFRSFTFLLKVAAAFVNSLICLSRFCLFSFEIPFVNSSLSFAIVAFRFFNVAFRFFNFPSILFLALDMLLSLVLVLLSLVLMLLFFSLFSFFRLAFVRVGTLFNLPANMLLRLNGGLLLLLPVLFATKLLSTCFTWSNVYLPDK